jgi:hypothetical protein
LRLPPSTTTVLVRMFTGIVEEMGTVLSMEEVEDLTLWDK